MQESESLEQMALFDWAAMMKYKYPELDLMYHVPNEAKRSTAVGAKMKRQGLKPGVPDICLPVAKCGFHGLYIELKVGKNKPTGNQREWLEKLQRAGHLTAVCWGWQEAAALIEGYLRGGIQDEIAR